MDSIVIDAALVATILMVTQTIKKLLESKLFVWILKLAGWSVVTPYIAVILSVVVGIVAGLTAYGADGLTVGEIFQIVMDIIAANGAFMLVSKASGSDPKEK